MQNDSEKQMSSQENRPFDKAGNVFILGLVEGTPDGLTSIRQEGAPGWKVVWSRHVDHAELTMKFARRYRSRSLACLSGVVVSP